MMTVEEAYELGKTNILRSNESRTWHGFRHECPCCGEWTNVEMDGRRSDFECDGCGVVFNAEHSPYAVFRFKVWVDGFENGIPLEVVKRVQQREKKMAGRVAVGA